MPKQFNPGGVNLAFDPLGTSKSRNERQPVGSSQKAQVFDSQKGKCWRCKNRLKLGHTQYHHVKHVSAGGKSQTQNLVALCANCHSEIHKEEKAAKQDDAKGKPKLPKNNDPFGLSGWKIKGPGW